MRSRDRAPKTHVLEGITATRAKILACGPVVRDAPTVGRAEVIAKKRVDEVTCAKCKRIYRIAS